MDSENEMENCTSSEESKDDVVEELEEEKNNKRNFTHVKGISDEDENDDFESRPKSKKIRFASEKEMKKLSKPATAEELNRLRETENLFHSNLFRLQIEEMLKEVQIKQKYRKDFQIWFEKFHAYVMKKVDGGKRHVLDDIRWLKPLKIKIPIPQFLKPMKGYYQFKKPLNIHIVGSYSLETVVGPKVTVDVVLELPNKFYQNDDFINGIYHFKRALYMCDLVSHIQNYNELVEEVYFCSNDIDTLRPKIEIKPAGKIAKYMTVMLNVVVNYSGNILSRFNPVKNNVRSDWLLKQEISNIDSPTPFYNSTILYDLTLLENHKFIEGLLKPYRNIKDGIILLKIWLKQRELGAGIDNFNGFLLTALVAYLLLIKKVNSYMSSYQVVRTVFNYFVTADWMSNGITFCKNQTVTAPTMDQFHENHKVVFVDATGYYNFCFGMHFSAFQRIQHEARVALATLDDPNVNSFQILFMTPVPFYRKFDHIFIFHNDEALQNTVDIHSSNKEKVNHCGTLYPQLINLIYDVLKEGFRQRINCIYLRQVQNHRWKPNKKFHYSLNLSFGINLNPENYYLLVDKAAESETKQFRQFWGERSELRRFQDGNITEAVVWNAKYFSEKRLICRQIVNYLMKFKFGIDECDIRYIADQFDDFIDKNVEESSIKATAIFDKLSKQLRNLKNLPLDIVSVQVTSPIFRYTEVYPMSCKTFSEEHDGALKNGTITVQGGRCVINPQAPVAPNSINPIQLVIHLGATNKWPQNLSAINRLRTAFYLKIAQCLTNQCTLRAVPFTDRIEVEKEGLVFHITIFCPNEIGLVKQIVEDGLVKYRDNELSIYLEKNLVLLPKLSNALHGLYEQHSSFGPACCIVKRWVRSQMMDSYYISDEVLEMLMASLYLQPTPHGVPQQPQTAFFRFLYLISTTDWNSEYIILNINNELNRENILDIEAHFTENRETLPALFIASPYDRTKSLWTKDCPTPLVLLRLVKMCGNVLDFIEKRIYETFVLASEFKVLLEPSRNPYDTIINLNKNYIPKRKTFDDLDNEENDEEVTLSELPVNGFDPVFLYVKELRETYGDVALFFYNPYGGSFVGVLWKPGSMEPKGFKVPNMAMHTYSDKTKMLHLERKLIFEDFMIIGKGLVKSVDVKDNGVIKSYTYL